MAGGGKAEGSPHRVEWAAAGVDSRAGGPSAPVAPADAVELVRTEYRLSFLEALRLYPKAISWSAFFSLGVISAAFDQQLVGSLFSAPQFQRDFGYRFRGEVKHSASLSQAAHASSLQE